MTLLRKILPLLLLLSVCLGALSCASVAGSAKYDKGDAVKAVADLRAFVREQKGVGKALAMLQENDDVQVFTYLQKPQTEEEKATTDGEPLYLSVITFSADDKYSYRLDLVLDKTNPETATRYFKFSDLALAQRLLVAEDTLSIPSYVGTELMSFDNVEYPVAETTADTAVETTADTATETEAPIYLPEEQFLKETARDMLNLLISVMDVYLGKAIKHDRRDFGFVSYDEKNDPANNTPTAALPTDAAYATLSTDGRILPVAAFFTSDGLGENTADTEATAADTTGETFTDTAGETLTETTAETVTESETEDPLGGPFSAARWSYALRMTVLGMGMVFTVLAILWGVLAIFKRVFAGKEPKAPKPPKAPKQKPEPTPAQVAPTAAAIPAGTDPAVVAAITAAIAEMIADDPALSAEFAGGFRVVSFKKKSGRTSWNH